MVGNLIINLLNKSEHEGLDFKQNIYIKGTYKDLIKDVIAMANARYNGSRYIVMGVKENEQQIKKIIGIQDTVDIATFQQLIFSNIEPQLNINLFYTNYENKNLACIEIPEPLDQPYMLKKDFDILRRGSCYIRKGSINEIATRTDFDHFYKSGKFSVNIIDKCLYATDVERSRATLECSFRNLSDSPVTIQDLKLEIWSTNNIITSHSYAGLLDSNETYKKLIKIPPKDELTSKLGFSFGSNDCLLLDLDEFGYTNYPITFKLFAIDTLNNQYHCKLKDCKLFVKREFLWKVLLKNEKESKLELI